MQPELSRRVDTRIERMAGQVHLAVRHGEAVGRETADDAAGFEARSRGPCGSGRSLEADEDEGFSRTAAFVGAHEPYELAVLLHAETSDVWKRRVVQGGGG
jgi:hypothetical protein